MELMYERSVRIRDVYLVFKKKICVLELWWGMGVLGEGIICVNVGGGRGVVSGGGGVVCWR